MVKSSHALERYLDETGRLQEATIVKPVLDLLSKLLRSI